MKRQRGRGRKPGGGGGGGGGGNHNHGNRSLESSGPDVKIRGTATQIYEKYAQYARDAQSGGDRVRYENFLQHAEHYYRVMAASMPRDRLLAQQAQGEGGQQNSQQNPDGSMQSPSEDGGGNGNGEQPDSMKVMDSEGADDGDDGFDDDGDEQGEEAEAGASSASSGGQNNRTDSQQDSQEGDRQARRGRRRGRRRHPDGPQDGGDRPQTQNANGNGGGDTEARSALDSLARKQGALAGS